MLIMFVRTKKDWGEEIWRKCPLICLVVESELCKRECAEQEVPQRSTTLTSNAAAIQLILQCQLAIFKRTLMR